MAQAYIYPGPKRLAAALRLAGFESTKQLAPKGGNPKSYGTEVRTMLGIAYGESSGNCMEVNDNGTSKDYGVWQINDLYEGDLLIRAVPMYTNYTAAQLRNKFGSDPRNTFWEYLRLTDRAWNSYIDNAVMARIVYEKSTSNTGFYPWVSYWNKFEHFSALDDPNRVDWAHIDRGLAQMAEENKLGYTWERQASIYLEGVADGTPLKR